MSLSASDDNGSNQVVCTTGDITHAPTARANSGEDGTGRGTPIIAATLTAGVSASPGVNRPGRRREDDFNVVAYGITRDALDRTGEGSGGTPGERSGLGILEEQTQTLKAKGPNAVAVTPIDMRQASRGEKMTNRRREGSSGGAPGTGIGEAGDPAPSLANSHTPAVAFHLTQDPISGGVSPCLSKGSEQGGAMVGVLAFQERGREGGRSLETQEELAYALTNPGEGGRAHERNILAESMVRRLTPVECCRLQGLPDDHLEVEPPLSDSAKYRMVGNGGAVPVVEWIAKRIVAADRGELEDASQC